MPQFRTVLAAVLCAVFSPAVFLAQTDPTLVHRVSASGPIPANIYSVDLNGDGFPDVIQDTAQMPAGFTVSLSNGDGTYKAPVSYTVPTATAAPLGIAIGDFNKDGKADLAIPVPGTTQVAIYLGKGDGTFQPVTLFGIALPAGQTFSSGPSLSADFNNDGNVDLVAVASISGAQFVHILQGDGAGGFSEENYVTSTAASSPIGSIVTGDFDGNGKADLAISTDSSCTGTALCNTFVDVFYNDGGFSFGHKTPYSGAYLQLSAGDANSDGITDLFGYQPSSKQMGIFYGAGDRTFSSYYFTVPNIAGAATFAQGFSGPFVLADLNGDGIMDIVGYMSDATKGGATHELEIFLGTANKGQYTTNGYAVPDSSVATLQFGTPPVAVDENGDGIPDIVINQTPTASGNHTAPSTLVTALNTTTGGNWGGCAYPKAAEGIHLCSPASSTVTGYGVTVTASATSLGQLRKIELWINGQKLSEQNHVWEHNGTLTWVANLSSGTYNATLFAADVDNRLQRYDFAFTVNQTVACSAPASPGVNICSPAYGSTGPSPLQVSASANVTGTLARMEVWVDGVKYYTETTSPYLNTSVNVAAGYHQFAVYAVNTAGTKWLAINWATVGSCAAPSSPGVNVCSPGQGTNVASPVPVSASANVTGTLARMEVWVDSVKYFTETTGTSFTTSLNVPAGQHQFGVYAVNTAGAKYLTLVTATVK